MATDHREMVDAELEQVRWRRDRGIKHPIDDFLFHYYNLRPAQLSQWHPGISVAVEDDGSWLAPMYRSIGGRAELDVEYFLTKRGKTVSTAMELLGSVANNQPRFGCFGMHEWAMVYGLAEEDTRHPYLKLRFPPERIAQIVQEIGCRCSHYDAFRFFTPTARPLNLIQPSRQHQAEFDQPGCLHVNMDLYKWAGKLWPAVSSELLLATFRLARDIRVVDMRASAYDLTDWGYLPIKVETSSGRREYVAIQQQFAKRAVGLRQRLLSVLELLGPGTDSD